MKIGAQTYTIREHLKNEAEIESSLRKLKSMGFNMVQLSGLGPCDFDRLDGWIKELELEICGTHSPWDRITDPAELKKLINEHKRLGCNDIGIGIIPEKFPYTYDGLTDFIKQVNTVSKIIKDNGLTFSYHNHELEFQKFNGQKVIDRLIEECPHMNFIYDVFWAQAGGLNPSEYIDKLKGRISIIHFKDFRVQGRNRQFAEIGQGNLDWADIIPRSEKNGIPWAVIEQDADFMVDCFDSLAVSRKFLIDNGYWKK